MCSKTFRLVACILLLGPALCAGASDDPQAATVTGTLLHLHLHLHLMSFSFIFIWLYIIILIININLHRRKSLLRYFYRRKRRWPYSPRPLWCDSVAHQFAVNIFSRLLTSPIGMIQISHHLTCSDTCRRHRA